MYTWLTKRVLLYLQSYTMFSKVTSCEPIICAVADCNFHYRHILLCFAFSYSEVGIGIVSDIPLHLFFYLNRSQHHTFQASLLWHLVFFVNKSIYVFYPVLLLRISVNVNLSSMATFVTDTTCTGTLTSSYFNCPLYDTISSFHSSIVCCNQHV